MTDTLSRSSSISSAELRDMLAADPNLCLLDVRTGGEYESMHIPGSFNVPLEVVRDSAVKFAGIDQPIVLVCQTGNRATQAHGSLSSFGKENLHVLDGGVVAWEATGGDVARGTTERWAMDRQVRLAAGSLVLSGLAASVKIPAAKWFAGAIGGGLTFSALSNTCAMGDMLAKLPYNRTETDDVDDILAQLAAEQQEIQL